MQQRAVKIGAAMIAGVLLLFVVALAIEFDGKWPDSSSGPEFSPESLDAIEYANISRALANPILVDPPTYSDNFVQPEIWPTVEALRGEIDFERRSLVVHCAVVEGVRLPGDYGTGRTGDAFIDDQAQRRIDRELAKLDPDASWRERVDSLWGDRWGAEVFFDAARCAVEDAPLFTVP